MDDVVFRHNDGHPPPLARGEPPQGATMVMANAVLMFHGRQVASAYGSVYIAPTMIRIFPFVVFLLVGCAGRSVPALNAKDLQFERFPELAPRAIALTVEEGRARPPEKSAEIVARVRSAVAERLSQVSDPRSA